MRLLKTDSLILKIYVTFAQLITHKNQITMKRKILQIIIIALLFIMATFSCKKDEPVSGLVIDPSSLYLGVGKTVTLTVTFIPANATNKKVSWESSDPHIATVNNGTITGVAKGKATISVISQDNGRRTQCTVMVIQPVEPKMVWVEGGTFTMGCTEEQGEDCWEGETPCHEVTVSGFYIGKYEVTQKEWESVMLEVPSYSSNTDDDTPIHRVQIFGLDPVRRYIEILNAYTGKNYRLPTEAEWEYAARGGNKSQHYKYSGSNNVDEVAFISTWSGGPHHVGVGKPNELEIYNMSGNVAEICRDWYGPYLAYPQTNPTGPTTGAYQVIRGGDLNYRQARARVSCRMSTQVISYLWVGFRLVLPAESNEQ